MKEHPILFSTPMVEAIIAGRKTQTRRIAKGDKCPYGEPGDILWVRETWQLTTWCHVSDENYGYIYKASENGRDWEENSEDWTWRPSIFMPKEACRLRLKITERRRESLHNITWEDAQAEGCTGYRPTQDEPTDEYRRLWEKINGPGSWASNPLVWVLNFEKI